MCSATYSNTDCVLPFTASLGRKVILTAYLHSKLVWSGHQRDLMLVWVGLCRNAHSGDPETALTSRASGGLMGFMLNRKKVMSSLNMLFDKQQLHIWTGITGVSWSTGWSMMTISEFLWCLRGNDWCNQREQRRLLLCTISVIGSWWFRRRRRLQNSSLTASLFFQSPFPSSCEAAGRCSSW